MVLMRVEVRLIAVRRAVERWLSFGSRVWMGSGKRVSRGPGSGLERCTNVIGIWIYDYKDWVAAVATAS
jgi:hypothetical protein